VITIVSKKASTETVKISSTEPSAAWRVVQRAIVCWVTACTEQVATPVVEADSVAFRYGMFLLQDGNRTVLNATHSVCMCKDYVQPQTASSTGKVRAAWRVTRDLTTGSGVVKCLQRALQPSSLQAKRHSCGPETLCYATCYIAGPCASPHLTSWCNACQHASSVDGN